MHRTNRRLTVITSRRMTDGQQRAITKLGYDLSARNGFILHGIDYLLTRAHIELLATQEEVEYVKGEINKLGLFCIETKRRKKCR